MIDFFKKTAVVGPMVDASALGLPSAIGYQFGKAEGRDIARARKKAPKIISDKKKGQDITALAVVPGSAGYLLGRKAGYRDELAERLVKWDTELKELLAKTQPTKKYRSRVTFLQRNIKRNKQLLTKMTAPPKLKDVKPSKQKTGSIQETGMASNIDVNTYRAMGDAFLSIAAEEMVAVRNFSEEGKIASDRREVIFTKLAEIRKEAMIKQASANGFINELTKIAHATGDENLLKIAQSEMIKEAFLGGLIRGGAKLLGGARSAVARTPAYLSGQAGKFKSWATRGAQNWWNKPGIWQKNFAQPYKRGVGAHAQAAKHEALRKSHGLKPASKGGTKGVDYVSSSTAAKAKPTRGNQVYTADDLGPAMFSTPKPEVIVRGRPGAARSRPNLPPQAPTTAPPGAGPGTRSGYDAAERLTQAMGTAGTGGGGGAARVLRRRGGKTTVVGQADDVAASATKKVDDVAAGPVTKADDVAAGPVTKVDDAADVTKTTKKTKKTKKTPGETTSQGPANELMPQGAKDWWSGLSPEARTAAKWGGGAGAAGLFLGGAMG